MVILEHVTTSNIKPESDIKALYLSIINITTFKNLL